MPIYLAGVARQSGRRWEEHLPRVNWASPQADGLIALCDARGEMPMELVVGRPTQSSRPQVAFVPEQGLASKGNGTSTYCSWPAPARLKGATNASVSAWVSKASGESAVVIANDPTPGLSFGFLWHTDGQIYCSTGLSGGGFNFGALAASGVFHLVLTFDGTIATAADRLVLYVNGVLFPLSSAGTNPTALSVNMSEIAWHRDYPPFVYRYGAGTVWQSAWYAKTLSRGEAQSLYNPHSRWDLYAQTVRVYAPLLSSASVVPAILRQFRQRR